MRRKSFVHLALVAIGCVCSAFSALRFTIISSYPREGFSLIGWKLLSLFVFALRVHLKWVSFRGILFFFSPSKHSFHPYLA